jgi:hypothetical protein
VASRFSKLPRKVATTMCLTAKLAEEWVGSSLHVPTGSCVRTSVAVAGI